MDTTIKKIPGILGTDWDTERISNIQPRGNGVTCSFDYCRPDGKTDNHSAIISAEQLTNLIDAARRTVVGFAVLPRVRAD